ncbi:MAG: COX15/CtaA family protein [Gammaproteobacteria bacterium]|nr:COX15/CtaA family protein [Gammaproteobacteria bacterium]MCW9005598.1 COX15/CtaA family protein [Gammaproteobacteria bacterium]
MMSSNDRKAIAIWLLICCATIFAMVVLGGVTRLTGSGLSMVQWEPIMGILPPLGQAEWQETFRLYQQFPEYKIKNYGMSLDEFKAIFWFEYSHRVLGRSIGMIFFFPMLYFFLRGKVEKTLKPKLITMFILGGLQGLMGWYMVKSGLVANPHVSQYRLTAHLALAFIVYAYIFWVAMDLLLPQQNNSVITDKESLKKRSLILAVVVFITVLSGGFVAGLKAGMAYNTFPLMNGQLIPDGLLSLTPIWSNFFENVTTVQFDHRLLATILFISIPAFWFSSMKKNPPARLKLGLNLLLGMLAIQVTLGISTLLLHVPVALAAAHQAGALILFTIMLFVAQQIRKA